MVSASVRAEIRSMSRGDLEEMNQYVANRFKQLDHEAASRMMIGQVVRFPGKRSGFVSGPITEIKRNGRLCVGRCSDGRSWTIPASFVLP